MTRAASDLAKMRKAGRVVAEMHAEIRRAVRPGVTTLALDAVGRDGARAPWRPVELPGLRHPPFPAVICASPNDVIVHGIPGPRVLDDGRHRLDRLRGHRRGVAR